MKPPGTRSFQTGTRSFQTGTWTFQTGTRTFQTGTQSFQTGPGSSQANCSYEGSTENVQLAAASTYPQVRPYLAQTASA